MLKCEFLRSGLGGDFGGSKWCLALAFLLLLLRAFHPQTSETVTFSIVFNPRRLSFCYAAGVGAKNKQ